MCILTWCGDFNWACPVVVEVTQAVAQMLNNQTRIIRLIILRNKEMSWQNATLSGSRRCHKEVKLLVAVSVLRLNQFLVDNAAAWKILELSVLVFHEKSLRNSFVDNNNSNLWLNSDFVVQGVDSRLKLGNFFIEDLITHSITYPISVYDKVGREFTFVILCKRPYSILNYLFHLVLDDFLSFFLVKMV
jgi:hypothetical protein